VRDVRGYSDASIVTVQTLILRVLLHSYTHPHFLTIFYFLNTASEPFLSQQYSITFFRFPLYNTVTFFMLYLLLYYFIIYCFFVLFYLLFLFSPLLFCFLVFFFLYFILILYLLFFFLIF